MWFHLAYKFTGKYELCFLSNHLVLFSQQLLEMKIVPSTLFFASWEKKISNVQNNSLPAFETSRLSSENKPCTQGDQFVFKYFNSQPAASRTKCAFMSSHTLSVYFTSLSKNEIFKYYISYILHMFSFAKSKIENLLIL